MGVYLEKTELRTEYNKAELHTAEWQKPFNEYERLARNKLSKFIPKNMPKVNDGSLAAALIETPMHVLPAMRIGKFKATTKKAAWRNEIANIVWKRVIVPNANTQGTFFDKEQITIYKSLIYGVQPIYNFFRSDENYTGSDFYLPYIRNVKLEPGKNSVEDCDYVFLDVFFTKLQLRKLVAGIKENMEEDKAEIKAAKQEGREPEAKTDSSWNIEALEKLIAMAGVSKDEADKNAPEREKNVNASAIKTTICFNRGKNAPFYMFSKYLEDGECLREWTNPDPSGEIPITFQYCYETFDSPYAMGRVELAGPTQNVLDFFTQAHVLATQVGLQPPKKVSGNTANTNLNSLVTAPDAIWQLGEATVDVVQTATSVYSQFTNNFGLYKAQLQNLQGRTDGSVSAEAGDPQFSKTPAGVNQQVDRTNAQDNYLRNKHDAAYSKMSTKMINVHFAMSKGADIIDVIEEDLERLYKAGYFDEDPNTPTPSFEEVKNQYNEIEILYEDLQDVYKFEFDPRPESDEAEKARWLEIIDIYASNPNLGPLLEQSGYRFDLGEAFKRVIGASGASDIDKVLVKIEPESEGTGEGGTGGYDPAMIEQVMQEFGINDPEVAKTIILAREKGYPEEFIINAIVNNNLIAAPAAAEGEVIDAA